MIAVVITPQMFAPSACGMMIALGLTLDTHFCATFAVLGTQLTAAMADHRIVFPARNGKYMM